MTCMPSSPLPERNTDYLHRVQQSVGSLDSWGTKLAERVLAHHTIAQLSRTTTFVSMPADKTLELPTISNGLECLVIAGSIADGHSEYPEGFYLRFPADSAPWRLYSESGCTLLLKVNGFPDNDDGNRSIDSRDPDQWLSNADGICDICPLHAFGGDTTMLVRWQLDGSFKPGLDPQGEEILVLSGTLSDHLGQYAAGTWLREPVAQWHHWQARAGSLIYYKSGHFPK
jgi:hypothetical protein